MVPKPAGSVRLSIDDRKLNSMTGKDAHPILTMDEGKDSLQGARVFFTLDCNADYWQIQVPEEDKHLTAFTCHSVLNRSGDRGWGTTVKWLSGLSLCVCAGTCFVGCPKVRPLLPTESTSQIVPTGPSAPHSRAHTEAHALAPNRILYQLKRPLVSILPEQRIK